MISEYDPMCEQVTGKPPKCTGCNKFMNRVENIIYSWNNSEWEEDDVSVSYQCHDCDVVIHIE